MRATSPGVPVRTLVRSSVAAAMSTALMCLTLLSQVTQEVDDRPVQQLGALPLQEVTGPLDDERTDQLAEGNVAHLWKAAPHDVVLGPVEGQRGHLADLEEARRLRERTRAERALVVAPSRAQALAIGEGLGHEVHVLAREGARGCPEAMSVELRDVSAPAP